MNQENSKGKTVVFDATFYAALLCLAGGASYFLWAIASVVSQYAQFALEGRPLPGVTTLVLAHRVVLLLLPLPWLSFAGWSVMRGPRSPHALIFFSSTLILAVVTLAIGVAVALVLPWMSIIRHMSPLP